MTDTKISGLSAVTSTLTTDEFVLARSGTTKKITAANLLPSTVIQEIVVPSGGSATVDFTSIPGTYRHLHVTCLAQTENGSAQNFQLRMNNDSGANYEHEFVLAASAVVSSNTAGSQTFGHVGVLPATGASGPVFNQIWVPYYAQTTWKKLAHTMWSYTGQQWGGTHFAWNSTAAITQLTFSSGASDIKEGSIFTLYGIL